MPGAGFQNSTVAEVEAAIARLTLDEVGGEWRAVDLCRAIASLLFLYCSSIVPLLLKGFLTGRFGGAALVRAWTSPFWACPAATRARIFGLHGGTEREPKQ